MKAVQLAQFGALDSARLVEVDDPVPGPGEVLVEIHAAAANYVDLVVARGEYQFKPALPYTPGKGPAGIVTAVGEGVDKLAVGDRVLAMAEYGGYAEQVCVNQDHAHAVPDAVDLVTAASMSLAYDTAWVGLRERARIADGDVVLVLGATGAVGGAAVQLARAMGASTVLAGVSSPERYSQASADAIVDLSGDNLRDSIREQVFAATDGHGADVIIDMLGGDAFDGAIRALAWRGRLVVVGFAAGRIPEIRANYLLVKNIEVSGLQVSDYRRRWPSLIDDAYRESFALCAAGKIEPPAVRLLPLDQWAQAWELISTRATRDRIVLVPDR